MKASRQKEFFFFTKGKTETGLGLLDKFVETFESIGDIKLEATKTMIGISNGSKRIAWITQIGKNFIHVVFPFKNEYKENLCFQKVARLPGDSKQVNHHFRMLFPEDLNKEVLKFMKLAFTEEK
ncbi:MAG: hypothetical protein JNL60_10550 [Bacteroidia bacterium]|nr:hypothetical protein [Bacteroidia bacterium]